MVVLVLALLMAQATAAQSSPAADIALARTTVERLTKGDFAAVEATFSKKLQAALPETKLRTTWQRLEARAGRLKTIGEPQIKARRELRGVVLPVEFEKRKMKIEVVFNAVGEIAGLLFN